ncbi:MAG: DegT/DnrJ/EryC1/StrS family aminotransferase [Thermoproteota archaeon]|jgi:dTDP-4-amino-4,6-dideoxygalactose transaminase|nr:DegT/DnrJ/EryC1/StrS family aminotransferase [Thermoproteota archaeon]
MRIPFIDLTKEYRALKKEIDEALIEVLESGRFILGPKLEKFEKNFAEYIGCKHGIGVASGTDALVLALKSLELPKGSEVITQSFTFISVADAIVKNDLKPVFCDVEESSYNMRADDIKKLINEKTKAIIVNHMFGLPAEIEEIIDLAKKKNIWVIEDASHAHGALYKNKKVGSFGDIACFSLYPAKILGAYGDAGIITTNNDDLAEKLRMYRNYGQKVKYYHEFIGYNSRLDEIQAAILDVKLKRLEEYIIKRREIASIYKEELEGLVEFQEEKNYMRHVYSYFVIRTEKRDELKSFLEKNGIETIIHYPIPIHKQKAYKEYNSINLPISERVARQVLSLPIHPYMEDIEIRYVIENIKKFFLTF